MAKIMMEDGMVIEGTTEELAQLIQMGEESGDITGVDVVERNPQTGDKIRITHSVLANGKYEVGDVLTVSYVYSNNDVRVKEIERLILRREFEIIGRNSESPTTTDRLDSLETRVTALEDKEEPKPKFSVGDYAKVIGNTCYGDIFKGTIVKVVPKGTGIDKDYGIELLDGTDFDYAQLESLEKVSEEVVKKAEAQAEKVSKFAAIGREVDEYKVGDIVEVIEGGRGVGNVGNLFKIESLYLNKYPVNIAGNVAYVGIAGDTVKLITPVERRFDK